ncbi:MAG: HEPN domain-containing protein [Candidatus Korarchaeota archaeon NZ13-K]|nr:MAG: HEPN domain-containing protein [Candidatus Korarchaeota archaeon NZ13-K]
MEEVRRLWLQALEDLKTAEILLKVGRYYASVFFAQQAAEKALKALYIHLKRELPPHTHNLLELLRSLGVDREDLVDAAADLTPEYIVTRYPNAAGGVPAELYNERSAREHLEKARLIVDYCGEVLGGGRSG